LAARPLYGNAPVDAEFMLALPAAIAGARCARAPACQRGNARPAGAGTRL